MDNKRDAQTFIVEISVQNNTLVVGANGGNVVGAPGDLIIWRSAEGGPRFSLEFFQLGSEPTAQAMNDDACIEIDVSALPSWPFSRPDKFPDEPVTKFEAVLEGKSTPATPFKYYVTVGNLRLDPIVIIDK
ncbi:MAG TPA: hypothetical protein VH209_18145 [Steroidobacteraceae bacterium]|jgi:hypothetical protein|nr:hypothetical protein [Steroidobacteraceae bacterium]